MVPRGRSPVRPSSNGSCKIVHTIENGGPHNSRDTPNGEESNEGQSLSPMHIKQEPGSPNANVSIFTACKSVLYLAET